MSLNTNARSQTTKPSRGRGEISALRDYQTRTRSPTRDETADFLDSEGPVLSEGCQTGPLTLPETFEAHGTAMMTTTDRILPETNFPSVSKTA